MALPWQVCGLMNFSLCFYPLLKNGSGWFEDAPGKVTLRSAHIVPSFFRGGDIAYVWDYIHPKS